MVVLQISAMLVRQVMRLAVPISLQLHAVQLRRRLRQARWVLH
jgi:hypothetical protein